jgi:hypothetical protein
MGEGESEDQRGFGRPRARGGLEGREGPRGVERLASPEASRVAEEEEPLGIAGRRTLTPHVRLGEEPSKEGTRALHQRERLRLTIPAESSG